MSQNRSHETPELTATRHQIQFRLCPWPYWGSSQRSPRLPIAAGFGGHYAREKVRVTAKNWMIGYPTFWPKVGLTPNFLLGRPSLDLRRRLLNAYT